MKKRRDKFIKMLNSSAKDYQDAYYEDWKNGRTGFQQIFLDGAKPDSPPHPVLDSPDSEPD